MNPFKALILAFNMYSRIPTPQVDWEGKHQQYVLCFFPLVGVVIGGIEYLWLWASAQLGLHLILRAAVAMVIPIALTGGIHLDGFCDTCDALASHQSQEKKLEILKDSHVGAFALIGLMVHIILNFAVWCQLLSQPLGPLDTLAICLILPLERALSGWYCVTMKNARGDGLLFHFTPEGNPKLVRGILAAQLVLFTCAIVAIWFFSPSGGIAGCLWACGLACGWFRRMAKAQFGGITGDLAGWFLQVCELLALAGTAMGRLLW